MSTDTNTIEKWRRVWRRGIAPQLSLASLLAVRTGLVTDDPAMLQGSTCYPPILDSTQDAHCEGACLIAYAGWRGESCRTVGRVAEYFYRVSASAESLFFEPFMVRAFINWFDDTPREIMRRELLTEVDRTIAERQAK